MLEKIGIRFGRKRQDEDATTREEKTQEVALVTYWQERLDRVLRSDRVKRQHDLIKSWQEYVTGEACKDYGVHVNLMMSTLNTVIPHIYARNPDISVMPAPSVDDDRYEAVRGFARTLEICTSRELRLAGLKRMAKRQVRQTMTTSTGWLKLGFQRITGKDRNPEIMRRIEDLQDNERHLRSLLEQDTEGMSQEEIDRRQAEIESGLQALREQAEVVVSQGLTLDKISSNDIVVDESLRELVDYRWANWIAQRFWYTADQLRDEYGLTDDQVKRATVWKGDKSTGEEQAPNRDAGDWYCVWEIWSKTDGVVYTMLEGYECWIKPPFTPNPSLERFYPFFLLGFNWIDDQFWPLSDIEMWKGLQDEYDRTRSAYAEHRRRTIPARVGRGDQVSPEEANLLKAPETNEFVLLKNSNVPAEEAVGVLKYPPVDMGLYDTAVIRSDLDSVSGTQDAARGAVYEAKTATEAEIQQSGLITRLSDKQDEIEEMMLDLAISASEMLLQMYSRQDVARIAGEGAVWPEMSKAEIFDQVTINIRAGTSGKPNKRREQEMWSQLMPIIRDTVTAISQYRAAGQLGIANTYVELLRETLRRADERLDLDRFIPSQEKDPVMQVLTMLQEMGHGEVAQQLMQLLTESAAGQGNTVRPEPGIQ